MSFLIAAILASIFIAFASFGAALFIALVGPDGHMEQKSEIELHHPPDDVAAWLTDFGRIGRWSSQIRTCIPLEPMRPFEPGARYQAEVDVSGARVLVLITVLEVAPGRRIRILQQSAVMEVETAYDLRETPGGGTLLAVRSTSRFRGLLKFFASSQRETAQLRLDEDLSELRRQMDGHVSVH